MEWIFSRAFSKWHKKETYNVDKLGKTCNAKIWGNINTGQKEDEQTAWWDLIVLEIVASLDELLNDLVVSA